MPASKVRLHHLPNWLRLAWIHANPADRVLKPYPGARLVSGWAIATEIQANVTRLDHWGSTTVNGVHCFVNEPYDDDGRALREMTELAEIVGGHVERHEESAWGHDMVRIALFENREKAIVARFAPDTPELVVADALDDAGLVAAAASRRMQHEYANLVRGKRESEKFLLRSISLNNPQMLPEIVQDLASRSALLRTSAESHWLSEGTTTQTGVTTNEQSRRQNQRREAGQRSHR